MGEAAETSEASETDPTAARERPNWRGLGLGDP